MNREKLLEYAEERLGKIESMYIMERVIEITLAALGNGYLYNYQIKDFMEMLYKTRLNKGTFLKEDDSL